eukprot:g2268.t1
MFQLRHRLQRLSSPSVLKQYFSADATRTRAQFELKRLKKLRRVKSMHSPIPPVTGSAPNNPLVDQHVLSSKQFDRDSIEAVMKVASHLHGVRQTTRQIDLCHGYILANLFFEPSTRTASSFETAMIRLGGQVCNLDASSSSAQKGETFTDTIRVMENYTDITVMRHPTVGSVTSASQVAQHPIINAGDGKGEHPTQALLDVFTIIQEFGVDSPDNLTITMCGDLLNGRTVHSLSRLLSHFNNVKINFVAPEVLAMPDKYIAELAAAGVEVEQHESYRDVLPDTDVFYMTRVQRERFATELEYEQCRGLYCLTTNDMKFAKKDMIVMHPLPRVDEIDMDVDKDPRAAYFRQTGYGLSLRMALLAMCLGRIDGIL